MFGITVLMDLYNCSQKKINDKKFISDFLNELADFIGITGRGVRKQLLTLLKQGLLSKKGHPPVVYYQIKETLDNIPTNIPSKRIFEIINSNYLYITPRCEKLVGLVCFEFWCKKQ